MSEPSNVVHLAPKRIVGKRRDADWVLEYDKTDRLWRWRMTVPLPPAVCEGSATTEAEARVKLERQLRAFGL